MAFKDAKIQNTNLADQHLKLAVSGSHFLLFSPAGCKLWRYRLRIAGNENLFAQGEYSSFTACRCPNSQR